MEPEEWDSEDDIQETPGEVIRDARGKFFKMTRTAIGAALILVIGFAGGFLVGSHGGANLVANVPVIGNGLNATPDQNLNLTDFWEAYNALNTNYVITHASSTMPTNQDKVYGAIEGLAASYGDPYTVFFPPSESQDFQDDIQGSFGGVGMEIDSDTQGNLVVVAPLKGTPADKAGVEAGDEIIGINGVSTQGLSPDDAVNKIRGPVGSKVVLNLVRGGKEIDITITRDTIQVPEIEYGLNKSTGVYTIALYEFTSNSAQLFDTGFTAFKASGAKDLVIDLRGNPGGYLDAAVDIASHFLPKGSTIVTEDYEGHQPNIVHTSTGTDDFPAGDKLAILIDSGSASASEILSGALQDHKVATLIGTKSFGKGSVQELIPIDGGSLKVTVARWITPNGHWIMGNGITPDIMATTSPATVGTADDAQMARVTQFFQTGK